MLSIRNLTRPFTSIKKKFWKSIQIEPTDLAKFRVCLDHKPLKTPTLKKELIFDRPELALLVAHEWETLSTPFFTSVLAQPLEMEPNEMNILKEEVLKYFSTDTLCFHASYPSTLTQMQHEIFNPLLSRLESKLRLKINTTTSLFHLEQPTETTYYLNQYLNSLKPLSFCLMHRLTMELKSGWLALGLMENILTIDEAIAASRLEQEHQLLHWERIENVHDRQKLEMERILSGLLLVKEFSS